MSVEDYFNKQFSFGRTPLCADVERADFVNNNIPDKVRSILEIGCGDGIVTRVIAKEYDVTGLELSSTGVEETSKLGITCLQGSIAELPFPDKSFDLVLVSEVLEHLDEEIFLSGLAEVARVASKHILVTVPNKERYQSLRQECPKCRSICVPWTHIRSFNVNMVRQLFDSRGFFCKRVRYFGPGIMDDNNFITRLLKWHRCFYNYLRPGMMCPVCKYKATGPLLKKLTFGDLISHPLLTCVYILDALANKLSPKCPRWVLAIYNKI